MLKGVTMRDTIAEFQGGDRDLESKAEGDLSSRGKSQSKG